MKIILSSPIPGEIAQLKFMLESAGIACFTRNEISAGLSPEIPLSESTPELWIQDDDHLAGALEIKRVWKTSAPTGGSAWVCPNCGETSEAQFSSCWKCGAVRTVGHNAWTLEAILWRTTKWLTDDAHEPAPRLESLDVPPDFERWIRRQHPIPAAVVDRRALDKNVSQPSHYTGGMV